MIMRVWSGGPGLCIWSRSCDILLMSELIRGLEKRDSSIVGSSSELVTAPVRAGQALEETTALMSVLV